MQYAIDNGLAGGGAGGGGITLEQQQALAEAAAAVADPDGVIRALQAKLVQMEARHRTREAEAAELAESTRRLAGVAEEKARREMQAVLDAKNAQVDAFRCELDSIVLDIKLMHSRQAEAAALAQRQAARRPRSHVLG